jgi:peptidoglycan/LPS O-acetylase OafA/YrhL
VIGLAAGVALGLSPRAGLFSYLGRYTLEIYLWHILLLYFGAWQYPEVLASCRQMPELIVIICAAAALAIAGATDGLRRLINYLTTHRVVIVPSA